MKFSVHQASLLGDRKYNQDRVAFAYSQDALLVVLADGMGGHAHGELAASIAIETFITLFTEHGNQNFADPQHFITETMQAAHQRIMQLPNNKETGFPGTTCVAALIQDGVLYSAYAGDSRLYMIRNQLVVQKTCDHSMVQQWADWGVISREEARTHPRRNEITNCLGGVENLFFSESCPPQFLRDGDRIVLCSDGFWAAFEDVELARAVLDASESQLHALMLAAYKHEAGRADNITALVVAWDDAQPERATEQLVSAILNIF